MHRTQQLQLHRGGGESKRVTCTFFESGKAAAAAEYVENSTDHQRAARYLRKARDGLKHWDHKRDHAQCFRS
jgi:hypothetical protein